MPSVSRDLPRIFKEKSSIPDEKIISAEKFAAKLASGEPLQMLDVRTLNEWRAAHLDISEQNMLLIPHLQLASRIAELREKFPNPGEPIYCLCAVGDRAETVVKFEHLMNPHLKLNLVLIEGGLRALAELGVKIVGDDMDETPAPVAAMPARVPAAAQTTQNSALAPRRP